MPLSTLLSLTGVKGLRKVGEKSIVVEYGKGWARPATDLEVKLWGLLTDTIVS